MEENISNGNISSGGEHLAVNTPNSKDMVKMQVWLKSKITEGAH